MLLQSGFDWNRTNVGISLQDGFSGAELASHLEFWPRTISARTVTLAAERRMIRSRSGLSVVPVLAARDAPSFDVQVNLQPGSPIAFTPAPVLDQVLAVKGGAVTKYAARVLGLETGAITAGDLPWGLFLRPIAIGILGYFLAQWLSRRFSRPIQRPALSVSENPN
jgi:hypothetical protein